MTHNYGRYIREAIESVLAQTRADWELIISDDASTDGTAEVVAPYLEDARIRYVLHAANLGQARNWAYLLRAGSAPIVAVLHADDRWLPEMLETALAAFAAEPELDLYYTNWYREREGRPGRNIALSEPAHRLDGLAEYRFLAEHNACLASACFMSRAVVCAAGLPDPELAMVVDWEYFLRIAAHARTVERTDQPLMLYREHAASTTAICSTNGRFVAEMERLPALCAQKAPDSPVIRESVSLLRRGVAGSIFSLGVTYAVTGDLTEGRRSMMRALRLRWQLLLAPVKLLDLLLSFAGSAGVAALRRMHPARLGVAQQ
jgi:hypothetical protein